MITAELPPYLPEAEPQVPPEVVKTLGQMTAGDQLDDHSIGRGLEQLEAHANSQPTHADTRIHDIEAAHEAALLENEIFDAHVAALKENEIFDAHVAALEEDKKRSEAKAQRQEPEQPPQPKVATSTGKTSAEQSSEVSAPVPAEELRREATAALAEAGLLAQLPATSKVSKELDGNLLVVDGDSAKIIAHTQNGKPKVTEYTYDKEEGTLTVSSSNANVVTGRVIEYEPTAAENWQTHDTIITLPPVLAKRFGIERAVVVNSKVAA